MLAFIKISMTNFNRRFFILNEETYVYFRLPLVQGGTISFLVPTLAILNLPQWQCPAPEILEQMSHKNRTELWQIRMRELSGAIAVSALFQVIIGFGGMHLDFRFNH